MKNRPYRGEEPYALKVASPSLSWNEVASIVGYAARGYDQSVIGRNARSTAHFYAKKYDMPWPIEVPSVVAPAVAAASEKPLLVEPGGKTQGEKAYRLRDANMHLSWLQVEEHLKITDASRAAKTWARRNNMPWPLDPSRAWTIEERQLAWQTGTLGEHAYELRKKGAEWTVLLGSTPSSLHAEKFALMRGLPWPLRSSKEEEERKTAAWLYQQTLIDTKTECRVSRRTGELAKMAGVSKDRVHALIRLHAEENNLPIPKRKNREQVFGRMCYELRLQGDSWATVVEKLGVKWVSHAITSARVHAKEQDLPWPIRPRS